MKYTGNYNLKKPDGTDVVNIEDLNENADIIDAELKKLNDAIKDLDADGITLPDGKTISEKFTEITKEIGNTEELDTETKLSLVAAINEINQALVAHKAEMATQDKAGHIKLSDIPLPAIATQSEAEAGTNNTKMMTPLRTHQAIDSRFRWVNGLLEVYMDGEWRRFEERPLIYGVEIDENNSNPETAVVYTDDAVGFTPARGNNGNFDWGSWEDIIKNEFKIRPCVLKNLGGGNAEVNYYLDYDDYTKKADGSNSRLDGVDGDVMIEFGQELWWKFTRIGSKLKIQLSTKSFDGAIKPAFEIENGYNLVPFYPLTLTQIIYVLMFKNLNSQTALGRGRTNADSYTNTGTTNKKTFCYGSTDATDNVKFLGMEDYFGNRSWWIDGCFYDNNRNMLIGKGNFNDTGSGYENFGQAAPSNFYGYINKVQGGNNTGFIPASTGGSSTTYYCDYSYVYASGLPHFGGYQSSASYSGVFFLNSNMASISVPYVGGRLFYSKDSKIYIGAYLGVEQNGKLRSISGKESANYKTIGSFRSLARANN